MKYNEMSGTGAGRVFCPRDDRKVRPPPPIPPLERPSGTAMDVLVCDGLELRSEQVTERGTKVDS